MTDRPILHVTPTSPYARLARIVVREKGLEDRVDERVARVREPGSPFYAVNVSGRVPYLALPDGTGIEDSAPICDYLDAFDGAPIFERPTGPERWAFAAREARARSMLDGLSVWVRELKRPENERSPATIRHEAARARRLADFWEGAVDDPVLTAPLNHVQIALATALQMETRLPAFDWRTGRPRLAAWLDAIARRPSFATTLATPA